MESAARTADVDEDSKALSLGDDSIQRLLYQAKLEAQANIFEWNWVNFWLQYIVDRFWQGTKLPLFEDRFIDRYPLFNGRSYRHGVTACIRSIQADQVLSLTLANAGKTEEALRLIFNCMDDITECLVQNIAPLSSRPKDVAFRWFRVPEHHEHQASYSTAQYFATAADIRCAKWQSFHPSYPIDPINKKHHVRGEIIVGGSPLISISTSPKRINDFYFRQNELSTQRIAVIDLQVLECLGISYGSTTQDFKLWVEHAYDHHYLVHGWLPSRCIVGLLDPDQSDALMWESDIETSPSCKKDPSVYDKKFAMEAIRRKLLEKGASDWYRRQEQSPAHTIASLEPEISMSDLQL